MPFTKGHPVYKGSEKGWFKKGFIPWSKSQKGITLNTGRTHFKKGGKPWNYGKKCIQFSEDNNVNWKGDKVGYSALHTWVYRHLGKANYCEICKIGNGKYEWANKSHQYKRNPNDWMSLCLKCHRKYDNTGQKIWESRRINGTIKYKKNT